MKQKPFSSPESGADREVVTSRVIDAPRERAFRAFSDPAHLAQWWGPKGFANIFNEFDLRPGGAWRFVMQGPDGMNYPNECRGVHPAPQVAAQLSSPAAHSAFRKRSARSTPTAQFPFGS